MPRGDRRHVDDVAVSGLAHERHAGRARGYQRTHVEIHHRIEKGVVDVGDLNTLHQPARVVDQDVETAEMSGSRSDDFRAP